MKRVMLTVAAAAWVAVSLAACRTAPSHAPTFKDLHELNEVKLDPATVEEQIEKLTPLFDAMQFTPAELRRIRDTGDVRLLVSAVSVNDGNNPLAPELLRLALSKAPTDSVPLAALAYWAVDHRYGKAIAEPEFLEALSRWRNLEPENSVPYYLEAGWWADCDRFDEAGRALTEASRHPQFETHCAALRLDVVAAADLVGYPKFTARFFALLFVGETRLTIAARSCLRNEGANEQVARDCIILGKRLVAGKTLLLDELMGTALQLVAMKKFPQVGSEVEQKRLRERNSQSRMHPGWMNRVLPSLTEERYVAFLDQVLAESEGAAFEKLASDFGASSK